AQNEPQAGMPASDDNPQHAFNAYRDDFPTVPPGPYDQVTASWAYDLPNHIVDGDLVVPPGKVFAMGDNRTESLDGRFWGFVPRENIVGRPMFVYWSFETPADQINKQSIGERIGFMGHILLHIFDETRWKRTLHLIK
ncbi:MAG TPA: signal peptidase I, partial [Edaphobacter sp.]|nr:signal peptidase I [Edaphobacter sp.]